MVLSFYNGCYTKTARKGSADKLLVKQKCKHLTPLLFLRLPAGGICETTKTVLICDASGLARNTQISLFRKGLPSVVVDSNHARIIWKFFLFFMANSCRNRSCQRLKCLLFLYTFMLWVTSLDLVHFCMIYISIVSITSFSSLYIFTRVDISMAAIVLKPNNFSYSVLRASHEKQAQHKRLGCKRAYS